MTPKAAVTTLAAAILVIVAAAGAFVARAQDTATDSAYIAKVTGAAPASIVKGATIVVADKSGAMRTVQKGTNGFTCMVVTNDTPMCADENGMAWVQALMTHSPPPNSVGFVYMLDGDTGASNTDPYASAPTAGNHWVKTGPHVMILGPSVKTMNGYPRTADPDTSKPYVMWAGTPYEHLMIPVK